MSEHPYLDDAARGWIVNTAKKNFWRVASWYSLEDLIQDGYLCFYKCHARYKFLTVKNHPLTEDKRRFMALAKAAYNNHITNLSNRRTATPEVALSQLLPEGTMAEDHLNALLPVQPEEATLQVLLAAAPKELRELFDLLVQDGVTVVDFARSRLRRHGDRVQRGRRALRETTNEHYCRRLGLDPRGTDLIGMVRAFLDIHGAEA